MATKTVVCPECDSPLAPGRFSCSACGALVASVATLSRPFAPVVEAGAPAADVPVGPAVAEAAAWPADMMAPAEPISQAAAPVATATVPQPSTPAPAASPQTSSDPIPAAPAEVGRPRRSGPREEWRPQPGTSARTGRGRAANVLGARPARSPGARRRRAVRLRGARPGPKLARSTSLAAGPCHRRCRAARRAGRNSGACRSVPAAIGRAPACGGAAAAGCRAR